MTDTAAPTIRPMRPDEVPLVARIWHDAWHDAHDALVTPQVVAERTPDIFVKRLAGLATHSYVVDHQGIPIAFAALWNDEIDQLFVERSWRGTGVARLLLSVLERRLAEAGTKVGRIECMAGNDRAHAFYRRNGWTDTGVREMPLWTPDGRAETHRAHLFVKALEAPSP